MHNLTYINDIDRVRLVILNDAVRSCGTAEEQQEIRQEILEIEGRRKSLSECTLLECSELRTAIWTKFDLLNRTGKYSIAHQFKVMLRQIETQQMLLHREATLAEAQKRLEEQQGKTQRVTEVTEKQEDRREQSKSGTSTTSSRWTTGIGNLN